MMPTTTSTRGTVKRFHIGLPVQQDPMNNHHINRRAGNENQSVMHHHNAHYVRGKSWPPSSWYSIGSTESTTSRPEQVVSSNVEISVSNRGAVPQTDCVERALP